jgi:hypothetical protein
MADVSANLKDWSTTASSNAPTDATTIGGGLADNFQEVQKVVRQDLANAATDAASGATVDLGAVASNYVRITGTTTITAFGTVSAGIWKWVRFAGALTLTHNATSLILPGGQNITTVAGDVGIFVSEGSGNWRCIAYLPTSNATPSALTSGRVPYATTGGRLTDAANLAFDGTTLTAHTLTVSTGLLTAAAATLSSTLTLSGTAANIALGENFISRAGTDAGFSLDASNNATLSGNLTVSGATITTGSATALSLATSGGTQVQVTNTASANRYITLTGSNGGNPTIDTSAGGLNLNASGNTALILPFVSGANRYVTISGSNGGNPRIGVSSGTTEVYNDVPSIDSFIVRSDNGTATNQYGARIFLTLDPNDASRYFLMCTGNATERATIRSNGGFANYQANDANLCDINAKTNVAIAPDYTDQVEMLTYHTFAYKDAPDDETVDITAQEIEEFAPELVGEWSGGLKSVKTYRLQQRINSVVPRLIKRVKALESRLQ